MKNTSRKTLSSFELAPGRKLAGKFEVISKLGNGWEGEVYKVREIKTNIERAAKLFFPHRNIQEKSAKAYAQKLHKLRDCSLLIHYHTQETIIFKKLPLTVLISEYVEGDLLTEFLKNFPGNRLTSYKALHLLYALAKGLEEIHLMKEYHGDLHMDNIIVQRFGLNFNLKLLDLFHWKAPKHENMQDDVVGLIKVFHESMGGSKYYSKHPEIVKHICCGLKRSLILKKFKTISQLRDYLESCEFTN
ncbi:MAG: protein kinase [Nitrospina sp.]|jgi:tRNA A-37 threonylcarbamoyl transferase component Bud32|nr:protein kinase [Nitrospina sp.]